VSALALGLVLVAAFLHAVWNFLLKRSGGGPGMVTAACLVSLVAYAPLIAGVVWWTGYVPRLSHAVILACAGLVHTAYFLLLDRAYRSGGDLSVVYPLARATGPLLTIIVAVVILGERPGPLAVAGGGLVVVSALALTGSPATWRRVGSGQGIGFALLTGLTITVYTLVDRAGVAALAIPPILYDWGCNLFRAAVLTPVARRRWPGAVAAAWRERRGTVVAIALLSPFSYILILSALVFTPVSLVAPAREVSILFAALMGAWFLREGDVRRRLLAAVGMAAGVAGLVVG
jgi:drug/metabolite transporter (DMT)-like permease